MTITSILQSRIAEQHLLNHPFYQRWTAGALTVPELQEYARQYYHYALAFPTFLSAMHCQVEDVPTRQLLLENLIEEERGPENHPELWLRFAEALGLSREEVMNSVPSAATRSLIDTVRGLCRNGELHEGLAAMYAYESQVPSVATTKIEGLAKWYGISAPRDIAFFAVHIDADVLHSQTSEQLLERLCDSASKQESAEAATTKTLSALYAFLDGVTIPMAA